MAELNLMQVRTLAGDKGYLRSHVDLAVSVSNVPPIYALADGITCLSTALCHGSPAYSRFLDPMLNLYPNLYLVKIGPTGAGKTRSQRIGQRQLVRALPEAVMPGDFTREALYVLLSKQPSGLIAADEFKGFLDRIGREYNAGLKEFLTEAYDSPPMIKRSTKGGGEISIESPRINITSGSTKEWFEAAVREGDFEGGWLSRFLFFDSNVIPPLRRSSFQGIEPIMEALAAHLKTVGDLDGQADFSTIEADAWAAMEKVHSQIGTVEPNTRGFWARINAHTIKLAMIFHVSDYPQDLNILTEDWSRATLLMDNLRENVQSLSVNVASDRTGRNLNRIRRLVESTGSITKRDALRKVNMLAKDFDPSLQTLIHTGEVHTHLNPNPHGAATMTLNPGERCEHCPSTES